MYPVASRFLLDSDRVDLFLQALLLIADVNGTDMPGCINLPTDSPSSPINCDDPWKASTISTDYHRYSPMSH